MKKHTYLLALLLLLLASTFNHTVAQCTYTTVKSGNFNDPTVYAVTGGGGCNQGSLPTSSSTIVLNHAVTLNQNLTLGNNGSLIIAATGSLIEDGTARTISIVQGSLTIAAVATRSIPRLRIAVFTLERTGGNGAPTVSIGANSAVQTGCFTLANQGGITLSNNSLLDVSQDITVTNGNGRIVGPSTGISGGVRVIGNFRGNSGGTGNLYNGLIATCYQQLQVTGCNTSTIQQTPPDTGTPDPTCRNVLPVTLTSFTGKMTTTGVELKWATASEIRNSFFEIQSSTDGRNFQVIGTVAGRGTTSLAATYTLTDYTFKGQMLRYYRLRQVDTDGTATLSSVVVVSTTDDLQAAFYPNPSNSTITLPSAESLIEYRVYSLTGQVLLAGQAAGNTSVAVHTIPAGVYILELTSGGKRNVQRFARQ